MKRACTDATGSNRTHLNPQANNDQDVRQDADAGNSRSTQQAVPTVSVANDRQAIALPAPLQHEVTSQIIPGQLTASLPVLRSPEAAESAHGSDDGQMDFPGSLALQAPGLTSCEEACMPTCSPSLEKSNEADMGQAMLDKRYRSELGAWVESAAPTERADHQEAERMINAYLEAPAKQTRSIRLLHLGLSTLPPLPADLLVLSVAFNRLTVLPEHLPQGLQELNVSHNHLTALPEHLPQALQKIYGYSNQLIALPEHLPQGLQMLDVRSNALTALPEHLPQALQRLDVSVNQLTALPKNLPQSLQVLTVFNNKVTAFPEHLPQGLRKLDVTWNNLTALPKHMPQSLEFLSVSGNKLGTETLVSLMRSNTSITKLDVIKLDIDADSRRALDAELVNNMHHPARLLKAAVTLDLLTRFGLTTSDQTGTLIKRDSTPSPVAGGLPGQSIPHELHHVLAANCPKDVLAVLAGMVDELGNEPFLQNGS